jgi:hypothetical protein
METLRKPPQPEPEGLIIYCCPACHIFVAASRDPKLIELARRYHDCPESQPNAA